MKKFILFMIIVGCVMGTCMAFLFSTPSMKCRSGDMEVCIQIAKKQLEKGDLKLALDLFKKACDADFENGCDNFAKMTKKQTPNK